MRALALALGAAATLAGCVASENGAGPVGPGREPTDGVTASVLFATICADTAPTFAKAPAAIPETFRRNPQTGTYYHQALNLSVKLMPKRCSMVFASNDDPTQLGMLFAAAASSGSKSRSIGINPDTGASTATGPKGTTFFFGPAPGGLYHAWLEAR